MAPKTTTPTAETVSTVVRMLIAAKRGSIDDLASSLGVHRTTLFDKLNGRSRWYADEVQQLAGFFNLPIATFYEGFAELADSQDYWPQLDSAAVHDPPSKDARAARAFAAA